MKIFGMGIPELLILAAIVVPIIVIIIVSKCVKKKQAEQPLTPAGSRPAIVSWKSVPAFSVLGATLGWMLMAFACTIIGVLLAGSVARTTYATMIPCSIIGIIYTLAFYPSYFTSNPLIRSSKVISFLNYSIGGIIFGILWNSNLKRSNLEGRAQKGISYAVAACFSISSLILYSILFVIAP